MILILKNKVLGVTTGISVDSDELDRLGGSRRRPSTKSWDYEDVRGRTSPGRRPTTGAWNDDDVRARTSTSSPRGGRIGGLSHFGSGSDFESGRPSFPSMANNFL